MGMHDAPWWRGWRQRRGSWRASLIAAGLGVVLLVPTCMTLAWAAHADDQLRANGRPGTATVMAVRPWYWGPLWRSVVVSYQLPDGRPETATVLYPRHSPSGYHAGQQLAVTVLDQPRIVGLPDGQTSEPYWFYPVLIPLCLATFLLFWAAIVGLRDGWQAPHWTRRR